MTSVEKQKSFIEGELTQLILANNDEFRNCSLVESKATTSPQLDGFMAIIFKLNMIVQCQETLEKRTHEMIVKLMKGSEDFRTTSKSFTQFGNEVYIYGKVIPTFGAFLDKRNTAIEWRNWCPKVYYYYYGKVPSLSNIPESVLVLKNISPLGFRNPTSRLELDADHLFFMLKTIGEYHALSYAMRVADEAQLKKLVSGIVPLVYEDKGNVENLYDVNYKVGLHRLFDFLDRRPELNVGRMKEELEVLRRKYSKCPTKLLDLLRHDDYPYSVIEHGDYNRNNVLFRYDDKGSKPLDMRMIDFQEVRYGSPAFDLSFFLYMNTSASIREQSWEDLLRYYHTSLFKCLTDILKCDENDERLKVYRFENFLQHFSRFAIYGVLVTIHFLPWMDCCEEECDELSKHFELNMKSQEFWNIATTAGGDASNEKILSAVKHASKMGYLTFLLND
ncbi:uncharacterized protein LOC132264557 [Phlebotomus argentipes]|uniref:uncharacterized protein LOC132264557 n=1 Tax=Phlebotomus argentipes TaxID=94469 RepID=UPI0028931DA6|nr:uncharacterized protein LOC132264557 [Phlebotomus argentipes]